MTDELDRTYARNTDPDTSHAAAALVDHSYYADRVVKVLTYYPGGLNSRELAQHTGCPRECIAPRLSVMERCGELIRGEKRVDEVTHRLVYTWRLP